MHLIVLVAIVKHTLGNGGRGVFLVCQNTHLRCTLNQGTVKFLPRTTGERNNAQIVIGHQEAVSQHLQGIEGGINHNVRLWHLSLNGIGEAEKQRVATGKDDDS